MSMLLSMGSHTHNRSKPNSPHRETLSDSKKEAGSSK